MQGLVPAGRDDPLWWTLLRPFRALAYHAAHAIFVRANAALGSNWSIHDLRHTAAYRMARDPRVPLTDATCSGSWAMPAWPPRSATGPVHRRCRGEALECSLHAYSTGALRTSPVVIAVL